MIGRISIILAFLALLCGHTALGAETGRLTTDEVTVLFEEPLAAAAKGLAKIYPNVKSELEKTVLWPLNVKPVVVLVGDREKFQEMVGTERIVAFAVPDRMLVVIDHSRMNQRPFTLGVTLKHELCHLLLHHHITGARLPKWLDEGVAQWASDGIAEVIMDPNRSMLKEVRISGNYIPLALLTEGFPRQERALLLAYEESKSFIEYIVREFGSEGLLLVLDLLREGNEVEAAFEGALSAPLDELEGRWLRDLRRKGVWLIYLTANLYLILFFLAAVITILGFIRAVIKKKRYRDEGDEDMYWDDNEPIH
jgi:hypothetical protein